MSTRVTVDHGEGHHLFADIFEPDKVYLEIANVEFTARPGGICVAIPAALWEKIRVHGIEEFSGYWLTADDDGENEPG